MVELLRWPDEQTRRELLSLSGGPRLLLVEEGGEPPAPLDCLEDWVRVPAPEYEVLARIDALAVRHRSHAIGVADTSLGNGAGDHPDEPSSPVIDDDGVLRFNGQWVALPPLEARITCALVDRFGAVTGREALLRAGWARELPSRNALDVHILRLRRRLEPVGLAIRTIRSRGYLMEAAPLEVPGSLR